MPVVGPNRELFGLGPLTLQDFEKYARAVQRPAR